VKCGVEFCFFLVRTCLGGAREIKKRTKKLIAWIIETWPELSAI